VSTEQGCVGLKDWARKKTIMREGERYKYSLGPNGQISHGSAAAYLWHSHASGAALPHQARQLGVKECRAGCLG
jgi:hypothetical protein